MNTDSAFHYVFLTNCAHQSSHSSTSQALANCRSCTRACHIFPWEHVFPEFLTWNTTYFQHNCSSRMESEVTVPTTRNKALCQWLSISLLWSQQQHTVCVCNCDHNSTMERDSLQQHLTWWNQSISSTPGIHLDNRRLLELTRLGSPGKNS
jgi:hypothetical protein